MGTCKALKRDGTRCTGSATYSDDRCWAHSQHTEAARKRGRHRGGRNRGAGSGELGELKAKVRGLLETLVEGGLETRVAAVAFQGYGVLLKAVEIERRVKDTEEIDQKLEEMRERLDEARREKYGDLGA